MVGGLEDGQGTITLPTGNVLSGEFHMGVLDTAHVAYRYPDGTYYEGGWVNGEQDGHGTAHYANGTVYDGEWHAGHPTGLGVLQSKGLTYRGMVVDAVPKGVGTLTGPKGNTITRNWNGWLHNNGPAVETNATGDRYEGNTEDLRRVGFGVLIRADGSTYRGQWTDNRPDGPGVLTQADGMRYDGIWHTGCFKQDSRRIALFPPPDGCP